MKRCRAEYFFKGDSPLETPYLRLQVLLLQMFSNGNWSRKSLFSRNNEQVIPAQISKLKLEVSIWVKVMKRCRAECFFKGDSPQMFDL